MKKNILFIVGNRPNFIKLYPLFHTFERRSKHQLFICHTGQHLSFNMYDIFWDNFNLPKPDFTLNIKGNNVCDTIGKNIIGINEVLQSQNFDIIIVFGDVNATVSGAIVGAHSQTKVAHIEAGLRSFDRKMPEEINRIITDHLSDFLFVSEPSGIINLKNEGFKDNNIFHVGNIMIETLILTRKKWESCLLDPKLTYLIQQKPVLSTFHRPENVDNKENLNQVINILLNIAETAPVLFPLHPRTKSKLSTFDLYKKVDEHPNVHILDPLGYFEFIKLISNSSLVITDSGGIQEETSYLNKPCITFRKNTERPITIEQGTNCLLSIWEDDVFKKIEMHITKLRNRTSNSITFWDDQVSERIFSILNNIL